MSPSQIESAVQTWFSRGLNEGDWDSTRQLFSDNFVYHGSDRDFTLDELQARVREYQSNYPGLHFDVERITSHGNSVGVSWSVETPKGTTWGVGRGSVANGRFEEIWAVMPEL
jgi:predicted ester cyclase